MIPSNCCSKLNYFLQFACSILRNIEHLMAKGIFLYLFFFSVVNRILLWNSKIAELTTNRCENREKIASGNVRLGLSQHWKGREINSWQERKYPCKLRRHSILNFFISCTKLLGCTHTWYVRWIQRLSKSVAIFIPPITSICYNLLSTWTTTSRSPNFIKIGHVSH